MNQAWREVCTWEECRRVLRFGVIGFSTWLFYFFLYGLLSRFLWPEGNRTLQNFIAIFIASIFNFFAHRRFTFCHNHLDWRGQAPRYAVVVFSAALLETGLFWIGHQVLHWYDLIVAVVANGFLAMYTYILHRTFTFVHVAKKAQEASMVEPKES